MLQSDPNPKLKQSLKQRLYLLIWVFSLFPSSPRAGTLKDRSCWFSVSLKFPLGPGGWDKPRSRTRQRLCLRGCARQPAGSRGVSTGERPHLPAQAHLLVPHGKRHPPASLVYPVDRLECSRHLFTSPIAGPRKSSTAVKDLHCGQLVCVFLSSSAVDFFANLGELPCCCSVPFSVSMSISISGAVLWFKANAEYQCLVNNLITGEWVAKTVVFTSLHRNATKWVTDSLFVIHL